ncbi:unnamed protein product [Rotaria sp. Silwood1]|nr:unnamed protein product [Rotaria sp. Silwood1]CAF3544091.1 unnamed protein product [Rotaria sp. Silwood1]CAF3601801.1 unnamed protein product [Rotaria sp. Silwood1]CAF3607083.1 unnamed protein product [Rotaria sp. Silwood1]CAF4765461.1 unnamed protein product [Rotaria sp. Silwood1]
MEYNVLSSLALCKQKRRGRLNERNSKRRALTNIRRNLLDTTHSEVCAASSNTLNTQVDNSFKNLSCSNSNNVNSNHCQIYKLQNLHSFDNMPELSFNETASDNISEVSIYEQENNESDEYFDLSTFFNHPDISLHDSTNVTKAEYCRNLLTLFRDANVFEDLFVKRSICTNCHQDLNYHNDNVKCTLTEERFRTDIYDIDAKVAFSHLINLLFPEITQCKQEIALQSLSEYNDIPSYQTIEKHFLKV